jgi:hypothetical protein
VPLLTGRFPATTTLGALEDGTPVSSHGMQVGLENVWVLVIVVDWHVAEPERQLTPTVVSVSVMAVLAVGDGAGMVGFAWG